MIVLRDVSGLDYFKTAVVFFLLWILVGFLTLLFLIISYLRKSKYDKKRLKKFFDATDWSLVCIAAGYFAPIVVFINYISHCRKDKIFEWIYDILYKVANIGVKKKSNKEEECVDKDEVI